MLEDDPDIDVVGEASNGDEADRARRRASRPHVVVMDCAMPRHERPRRRRARFSSRRPDVAVLILSMHSEETLVRQALDAGARGYILKNALDLDLAAAVQRVAAGEQVLDPHRLLAARRAQGRAGAGALAARARSAAAHLRRPLEPRDRGPRLTLSVNTVAVHRANIMNALGVHKTAELVVYAIQHGLVDVS